MPLSERDHVLPTIWRLPERSWLRSYLNHCATVTDGNLGFHVVAGLTVLAQSIPPTMTLPWFGRGLPLNLFGMLVAPSTRSRKSTAVQIAAKVLQAAKNDSGMRPPGSWQQLRDMVIENPQRLLLDEEFGNTLGNMDQSYLRGVKTTFLELYDCTPLSTETREKKRNKQNAKTDNPRVSALVAVADSFLEEHTTIADWTGGYLGRFTTIFAGRGRLNDTIKENDDVVKWLGLRIAEMDATGRDVVNGSKVGKCLGRDEAAERLFKAYSQQIDREAETASTKIQPAIDRSPAMVQKIAGLLAWDFGAARSGYDWRITGEEMLIAIEIARMHVMSVKEIAETLATDPRERERNRILKSIDKRGVPFHRILKSVPELMDWQVQRWINSLIKDRTVVRLERLPGDDDDYYRLRLAEDDAALGDVERIRSNVIVFPGNRAPLPTNGVDIFATPSVGASMDIFAAPAQGTSQNLDIFANASDVTQSPRSLDIFAEEK